MGYNQKMKTKHKSTIDGYIRAEERKSFSNHSFYRNIPLIINHFCMKYYHESKDRFDPHLHGRDVAIISDNRAQIKLGGSQSSMFLSNIVNTGYHEWRFKLTKKHFRFASEYFGIWNNRINAKQYLDRLCYPILGDTNENKRAYGLNATFGELRGDPNRYHERYSKEINTGDIIDMCLDLNINELSYRINDTDYGKAFDIDAGEWRACVCLAYAGDEVILVHYKQK